MRIISKFKDYYDSGMGLGVDETVMFLRIKKVLCGESFNDPRPVPEMYKPVSEAPFRLEGYLSENGTMLNFYPFLVYFCGEAYRGLTIKVTKLHDSFNMFDKVIAMKSFYAYEDFKEFLHTNKNNMIDPRENRYSRNPTELDYFKRKDFNKLLPSYFNNFGEYKIPSSFVEACIQNRLCIASLSWEGDRLHSRDVFITENPCLSDFQFFKVFPPHVAYQNLDMYISGVLGAPNAEPLPISDKDRAQQHGFDKRSFRKDPSPGRAKFRTS